VSADLIEARLNINTPLQQHGKLLRRKHLQDIGSLPPNSLAYRQAVHSYSFQISAGTEVFPDFLQSLQANSEIVPLVGHDRFFQNDL
jgi:hypothetical protein